MDQAEQEVQESGSAPESSLGVATNGLDLVIDVPLRLTVEVGSARMLVREVLQLAKGSVLELDRNAGDPSDLLVNGRLLARGEVTVVDDRLAFRVLEVLRGDPPETARR